MDKFVGLALNPKTLNPMVSWVRIGSILAASAVSKMRT